MTSKTKKIIAREGLVIIGIVTIGYLIAFVSSFIWERGTLSLRMFLGRALSLFSFYGFPSTDYPISHPLHNVWFFVWLEHFGEFIFLYGYLICLCIRFIIWAVKTVREK